MFNAFSILHSVLDFKHLPEYMEKYPKEYCQIKRLVSFIINKS